MGRGSFSFRIGFWPTQAQLDIVDKTNMGHMIVSIKNPLAKRPSQKQLTMLVPCIDLRREIRK